MPDTYDTLIPDEVWEQSGFLFPRPGSRLRTTPIKSLFQKLLNRDEYIKKVVGRLAGTTNWDDIPPSNIQSLFNQLGSLDTQFNALNTSLTQHKTAAVLDHPDSSVTDSKIGNRTINDSLSPTTDTNNLTTLLSNLANRIKSITGSTGWKDNPPDTLINLNNTVARKGVNETITGAWTFNNNVVSSQTITASRFISTVASGTAPLVVTSNTRVANLNADLLDGYDSLDFPRKAENATITGNWTFNGDLTIQRGRYITYNSYFRVMYPRWGFATNSVSSANKWQKIGTFTFTGNYQKCHIHAIIWGGRDEDVPYATQHLVMEIDTESTPSIVTTSYILGLYLEHAATSGTTNFAIKDARIVIPDPTNYPNVAELWVQWNVSWALISPEVRLIGPNSVTVSLNTDLTDDANLASTSPPSTGTVLTPNHTSISDLANKLATARTISLGGSLSGSTSFDGSSNVTINASINAGAVGTTQLANGSVTAPKLATGAITGSLGYTPLNKAGDTMTGQLINTERIFAHRQVGSGGPFISLAIGDDDTGLNWVSDGVVNMVANGTVAVQWSGFEFNANVPIKGRYDHQRRFTVSGNVGGTNRGTLNSGTSMTLQTIPVNLNNQTLRLVRARFWNYMPELKLRVRNFFTWTSSNAGGEHVPNFNLCNVLTGTVIIYIDAVNDSGSEIPIPPGIGWWLEFEIV